MSLPENASWVIAVDEAGYGPVLGPLVVVASAWQVPPAAIQADWYQLLDDEITANRPEEGDRRLWIADSKRVYRAGDTLDALERGVLNAVEGIRLGALKRGTGILPQQIPSQEKTITWKSLWRELDRRYSQDAKRLPWTQTWDLDLPRNVSTWQAIPPESVRAHAEEPSRPRLESLQAVVIWPPRFNHLVQRWGNKGTLLSHVSLRLVSDILMSLPPAPADVWCDKHGGRNHYAALVQHFFSEQPVRVLWEGRAESCYSAASPRGPLQIRFSAKGDRQLPTALSSMVAKYLRELSMRAWNQFWCSRMPRLHPTAGYAVDGRRFHDEIKSLAKKLHVPEHWMLRAV